MAPLDAPPNNALKLNFLAHYMSEGVDKRFHHQEITKTSTKASKRIKAVGGQAVHPSDPDVPPALIREHIVAAAENLRAVRRGGGAFQFTPHFADTRPSNHFVLLLRPFSNLDEQVFSFMFFTVS